MTEQTDVVKVFISWSGDSARAVAKAIRDWLPLISDRVAPWVSDSDIAAGQRGLAQIEAELADTRFGIVVVTAANQHAPWLNFEAGALSRTVGGDTEHRVIPLLVDLTSPADLSGPLAQFQAKTATRDGLRDVVLSLAAVAGIDLLVTERRFELTWPDLEPDIESARAAATESAGRTSAPTKRDDSEVLSEILEIVRGLRTDMPRHDVRSVLSRVNEGDSSPDKGVYNLILKRAGVHGVKVDEVIPKDAGGYEVRVRAAYGNRPSLDRFARDVGALPHVEVVSTD